MIQIQVVNTRTNNISNVLRALTVCEFNFEIIDHASQLTKGSIVILPGVGSFSSCMDMLIASNFDRSLRNHIDEGGKLLGICVGMQVLAKFSTEFGYHKGLSLIDASVKHLSDNFSSQLISPNVNWLPLSCCGANFKQFQNHYMYFVHSYHMSDFYSDQYLSAVVDYQGKTITAIVEAGTIIGFQFHPEKSGTAGLELLKYTLKLLSER